MIRVLHNFGGKVTSDKRVLPGVYEEDAPELHGAGEYMIANGHAERLSLGERIVKAVQDVIVPDKADEFVTFAVEEDADERPVKKGRK